MSRRGAPRGASIVFAVVAACSTRNQVQELADAGLDAALPASDDDDAAPEDAALAVADSEASALDADVDIDAADATLAPDPCADAAVPPASIACTGLYTDVASKTLSPSVTPYAPAVPLWSDGAEKARWISLPPGQKIDISNPDEWVFPIGTKLFKEFSVSGKRVETRMFHKLAANFWVHATYAWNSDDSEAPISYGATVPSDADGGTWVIPTSNDCDSCHRGRSDRILGFEQVSLGLAGSTGLTLFQLAVQDLVTPVPALVNLRIGDDGTTQAAPALAWLHVNCGVTCHNGNENAIGYGAKMDLRLTPTLLDGSPSTSLWGPLKTTLGVPCVSGSVQGRPRISPGAAAQSVIIQLISQRGELQMPPVGTRLIDSAAVSEVTTWINAMALHDAGSGVEDAGTEPDDAGDDGPGDDAGGDDAQDDAGDDDTGDDAGGDEAPDDAGDNAGGDDPSV